MEDECHRDRLHSCNFPVCSNADQWQPSCRAAIRPPFGRAHLKSVSAGSFGIASLKAIDAKQLEDALHKAFALNAPALVWVPHGDVPSPWDMIMMPKVR